jgi:hypothetical protein
MTHDPDANRGKQIEALMAAARVERAREIRRLLQSLFRRRTDAPGWHPAGKPAVSDCR